MIINWLSIYIFHIIMVIVFLLIFYMISARHSILYSREHIKESVAINIMKQHSLMMGKGDRKYIFLGFPAFYQSQDGSRCKLVRYSSTETNYEMIQIVCYHTKMSNFCVSKNLITDWYHEPTLKTWSHPTFRSIFFQSFLKQHTEKWKSIN